MDKYRKLMKENKWELGEDDEELFEYAMHPAQYEAYKRDVYKRQRLTSNVTIASSRNMQPS